MNTAKNSSDDPRSFCCTMIRIESAHGTSSGPRCFGSGRCSRPMPPAPRAQQLALLHQVRGEEDHEQHLGHLAGLDREAADADPEAGAVDRGAEAGHEREQQRAHAEQQERVLVAARATRALRTNDERERRTRRRPTAIHTAWVGATWMALCWASRSGCRSSRVSITKPMPSSRLASGSSVASARGASRRTATCAAAEQPDEHREERDQSRRDRRRLREPEEHVPAAGDDEREQPEAELAVAAVAARAPSAP